MEKTDPAELSIFVDAVQRGYDFAKGIRLAHRRPQRMLFYRSIGNKI
jgi:hypothetical protein